MAKTKLGNVKGPKGDQGVRGSKWYNTDKITGESTSGTAFPQSGISDAMPGDMALNPTTLNLYICREGGAAASAKWAYLSCIKGPQGERGPKGEPTTVDASLSESSTNPVQNKIVASNFKDVRDSLSRVVYKDQVVSVKPGESTVQFDFDDNLHIHTAYVREVGSMVHSGIFLSTDTWDGNVIAVHIDSTRADTPPVKIGCSAIVSNV